ncbi:MBL fold metallo-hydrolase [Virgibacillus natechei]|uniref:MBL fold metallo-hydrolase n=1 Tax=Virgibacillus natechei TaxID=1216297 RepID=UPI002232704A|nr:MBL fold metallo-hydrolase [Virgibacillus natechei]UZD14956.1 MBL fold metallo-hydrolase [Virgibacillus natechei]
MSNRIYYLPPYQETDRPILGAVVGDEKTVLIDAGNSSSHAKLFLDQLEERSVKGNWLVLTHWHWDHVFGMSEMKIPIISNKMTYNGIKQLQELSWEDGPLDQRVKAGLEIPFCADAIKKELGNDRDITLLDPDIQFETRMKLNLGGLTCVIEHVGGDHSNDSSIIYIPEEKVLFLGDCLYANLYADKWNYTIDITLKLIERMEEYDAEIVFLSHHNEPLNKSEFQAFLQLLKKIGYFTEKYNGDYKSIAAELSKYLRRELNEMEVETIAFFVNGYSG